jgi:hypothetical protein
VFNELTDEVYTADVGDIVKRRAALAETMRDTRTERRSRRPRAGRDAHTAQYADAETYQLKSELAESAETIEILKGIINKYIEKA